MKKTVSNLFYELLNKEEHYWEVGKEYHPVEIEETNTMFILSFEGRTQYFPKTSMIYWVVKK